MARQPGAPVRPRPTASDRRSCRTALIRRSRSSDMRSRGPCSMPGGTGVERIGDVARIARVHDQRQLLRACLVADGLQNA